MSENKSIVATIKQPLYQHIASAIVARRNCTERNNTEWHGRWTELLDHIAKNLLPSGSGIDCGSTIDIDASDSSRFFIDLSFHHMNENGYYDGWTEHRITVKPSFDGIDLRISGKDRNEIKDYLHEVYDIVLREMVSADELQTAVDKKRTSDNVMRNIKGAGAPAPHNC